MGRVVSGTQQAGQRRFIPAEEGHRLAREAVERALALKPEPARGPCPKWDGLSNRSTSIGLERMLPSSGAIALEPGDPEIVRSAAGSAAILGRFDEALPLKRRAVDLDPLNADSWGVACRDRVFDGAAR